MSVKSKTVKASVQSPGVLAYYGGDIGLPMAVMYRRTHESHGHPPARIQGHYLIYLLEGRLRTKLEDGRILDARGGMMYIIAAGVEHVPDEVAFGPAENALISLQPPRAGCAAETVFSDEEYQQIFDTITQLGCEVWHMPKPLIASLRRLTAVMTSTGEEPVPYQLPGLRAKICDVLVETLRACSAQNAVRETEFVGAIEQYVAAHYDEELSVSRIAEYMGYDPTWLQKRFKRESGYTLNHYIQDHRVSVAKQMLRETEREITDIALESGFGSSQHFCHVFRKITGMTASEYRKKRRG